LRAAAPPRATCRRARGQLFDPKAYRWLETPWISDGVVLSVLSNLLVVKGERISYRALDVEQIGSVYEGIMGYAVRRIPVRCIGLKSKPQGAKKQLTTAVDLDSLLELPGGKRKTWLEEQTGTTLPPKAATALKDAASETEFLEALASRIDRELFDGPQAAGDLVFQPTEERRRSGSHYTPRALTRPIVEEALRPWLERCNHQPTAAQILDLKIRDPTMGSGAFLVESCRFLTELLELAWSREGLPEALQPDGRAHGEEPLLYARWLIAQGSLYGVDKNPFAVNLARLSLWLVSLSKDAPFTFVDHALKCGDSLVGMERSEIEKALGLPPFRGQVAKGHAMTLRLSTDDQPNQDQTPARDPDGLPRSGAPAGGQELRHIPCRQPQRCRRRSEAPGARRSECQHGLPAHRGRSAGGGVFQREEAEGPRGAEEAVSGSHAAAQHSGGAGRRTGRTPGAPAGG
jgi:hypothetical protein